MSTPVPVAASELLLALVSGGRSSNFRVAGRLRFWKPFMYLDDKNNVVQCLTVDESDTLSCPLVEGDLTTARLSRGAGPRAV